jgi:hypothetical protein
MVASTPLGPPLPPPLPYRPVAAPARRRWVLPVAVVLSFAAGAVASAVAFGGSDDAAPAETAVATTLDVSDEEYASAFGELLLDIESMEAIALEFGDAIDLAEKAFVANWEPGSSYPRFRQLADAWWSGVDRAKEKLDDELAPELASFRARAFPDDDDGARLRQIRDAAVDRYEAWVDFGPIYRDQIIEWSYGEDSSTFEEHSGATLGPLRERITSTFRELCDTTSANQPTDGEYSNRIAAVCEYP